jgi:hypothetical protein
MLPFLHIATPSIPAAQPAIVTPAQSSLNTATTPAPMSQARYECFIRTLIPLIDKLFVYDAALLKDILIAMNKGVQEKFSTEEGREAFGHLEDRNAFMISGDIILRI